VEWSWIWNFIGERMQEFIDALIYWEFFNVSLWQIIVVFVIATALELILGSLMRHKMGDK
jgi:hypothetical protein